jgi:hypothetical protein
MFPTVLPWPPKFLIAWICGICSAYAATPYYSLDVTQVAFTGPVNQSALNRALTANDRISIQRGHFFSIGQDGQAGTADDRRVRLYGVNLSFSANFPDAAKARQIARDLRSLGFNAVRLTHLDSAPDKTAGTARSVLLQGPFPTFNSMAVERLKVFLKALKEEGIYANLNLYVGYRFRPTIDKIPGTSAGNSPLEQASPVHIFHPRLVAFQATYAKELIRLLGIGNDPMLAMVEIRNESSLASAWQAWDTKNWTNQIQGEYADELTRQWNNWLVRTHGSVDKACEHWAGCVTAGVQPLISPAEADEFRDQQHTGILSKAANKLKTWTGWSVAPDVNSGRGLRILDFTRFIVETDKRYFDEMKRAVRTVIHPLVPITGTQMSTGGPLNYLSQGSMDYLDDHFYIDHFNFPGNPWDPVDWRIRDSATITKAELDNLMDMGKQRDFQRPFVVSEYNQNYPNRQGAAITPLLAVLGVLQDWDGIFHYDYTDGDNWGVMPSGFRLSGDWPKLALTGQSAKIFRTDLISPLSGRLPFLLDVNTIFQTGALRLRKYRGAAANPWPIERMFETKVGTIVGPSNTLSSAETQTLPSSVTYVEQDSRVVFSAPRLAGFIGKFAPGQRIDAGILTFEPLDAARGFATVVVTSLDEQPIAESTRILVSVPGHIMESQPEVRPPRPRQLIPYKNSTDWWTLEPDPTVNRKSSATRNVLPEPLWMERVPMKVTFRSQAADLKVFPLSLTGERLGQLAATSVIKFANAYELTLQLEPSPRSPWYEIVITAAQK